MLIGYIKKRLYISLLLGILWFSLGLSSMLFSEKTYFTHFGFFIIGFIYISVVIWQFKKKYFEITENSIKESKLFGKKMNLDEITEVKYFAGDYILKFDKQEIRLYKELIDPNQLPYFEKWFHELVEKTNQKNR